MEIIVISGKAKGVGKTSLASYIIGNLNCRVGVIKTSLEDDPEEILVTDRTEVIKANGTDTAMMDASGADKVVYLKSDYENLKKSLDQAKKLVGGLDYLIIEGNSVLDYINPALIIYLTKDGIEAKPSALKAESKADIILNYEDYVRVMSEEKDIEKTDFHFTMDRISCYKSHLIGKVFGIKLPVLGKILDEKGIKVKHCQLGLF